MWGFKKWLFRFVELLYVEVKMVTRPGTATGKSQKSLWVTGLLSHLSLLLEPVELRRRVQSSISAYNDHATRPYDCHIKLLYHSLHVSFTWHQDSSASDQRISSFKSGMAASWLLDHKLTATHDYQPANTWQKCPSCLRKNATEWGLAIGVGRHVMVELCNNATNMWLSCKGTQGLL